MAREVTRTGHQAADEHSYVRNVERCHWPGGVTRNACCTHRCRGPALPARMGALSDSLPAHSSLSSIRRLHNQRFWPKRTRWNSQSRATSSRGRSSAKHLRRKADDQANLATDAADAYKLWMPEIVELRVRHGAPGEVLQIAFNEQNRRASCDLEFAGNLSRGGSCRDQLVSSV
jgi:hypothetical protein